MTLLGALLGLAVHLGLSLVLVALFLLPFGFNERLYHLTAFGWILPGAPGAAVLGALAGLLQRSAPSARSFVLTMALAGLNAFFIAPAVMLLAVGAHPARLILLSNYFVMGIISGYLVALPVAWAMALPLALHQAGRPQVRWRALAAMVTACAVLGLPFAVWPVHKEGQFAVLKVNEAIFGGRPAEALAAIQAGEPVDVLDRLGSYAIIEASEKGDAEIVRALLARGASVAVTDGNGLSAIFLAAQSGNVEVLRALLAAGADVNDGAAKGHTPLSVAVRTGNADVVRFLLKSGARLDVKGASGPELARRAWDAGHHEVAAALAEHGVAGPSEAEKQGRRALEALRNGRAEEALSLLRQGADPNARDSSGSLLVDAIRLHQRPLVEALLAAAGVDPNLHAPGDDPALTWAVREEPELVPGLLARGARPDDRPSAFHPTALLEAAEFGDLEVVKALVRAGADLKVAPQNRTALERAAAAGNADVVAFLRQAGAPPGEFRMQEWKEKDARLAEAAREGKTEDARFWLRHGADPNGRLMPLLEAVDAGHTAMVELLLAAGADPLQHHHHMGRTPLDAAAGKDEILALLQKAVRARTMR